MSVRRFSAIARPVDPKFPTNRAVMGVTMALAAFEFLRSLLAGSDWPASAFAAAGLGLTVFLTWAICREIDPDRDLSAFVASGFAFVGVLLWGLPDLAVIFWLLLTVRVVNRTTGLRATALDFIAVLSLATWLAFRVWWPIGAFTAVAFLLDGWLVQPHLRHRILGFVALAITLGAAFLGATSWSFHGPAWASCGMAMVLCMVFVPVFVAARELTTLADDTKERLSTSRVRASQMLALLVGVTAVCWTGADGLVLVWPLWSAVLGASAFLLLKSVVA
jgi:hypothetical protein